LCRARIWNQGKAEPAAGKPLRVLNFNNPDDFQTSWFSAAACPPPVLIYPTSTMLHPKTKQCFLGFSTNSRPRHHRYGTGRQRGFFHLQPICPITRHLDGNFGVEIPFSISKLVLSVAEKVLQVMEIPFSMMEKVWLVTEIILSVTKVPFSVTKIVLSVMENVLLVGQIPFSIAENVLPAMKVPFSVVEKVWFVAKLVWQPIEKLFCQKKFDN
jgi:hypothetical protein